MNKIEFGDCREIMKRWSEEGVKVKTCITSPPYYGLRDYGTAQWEGGDENCDHIETENKHGGQRADRNQEGYKKQYKDVCKKCGATRTDNQIGLEETPEEYIEAMVEVFRGVWDILEDDGTLWLNIGDSYYNYRPGKGQRITEQSIASQKVSVVDSCPKRGNKLAGLKEKDLIGIPWRLALALQADGWYLRQDIIWHKPNPMPESVTDRCTKAHEYIFLLTKKPKYYFDYKALQELAAYDGRKDEQLKGSSKYKADGIVPNAKSHTFASNGHARWEKNEDGERVRRKRSVWTVTTKPYSGAHFATFPPDLITPCVLAGSKEGDIVFDPFMGSGTTAQVALFHNRKYLGCELNENYKELQQERISSARNLFNLFDVE